MNILHINTYDSKGGAAKAAHRIHREMRRRGLSSTMLVQSKKLSDPDIVGPDNWISEKLSWFRPYLDYMLPFMHIRGRVTFFPAMIPDNVPKKVHRMDPDIVNLHWISEGFIRIESLASIKPPVVWTLHDMWAFTGGCHYSGACDRYTRQCGKCPVLRSTSENDLSRNVFLRKENTYRKMSNLTLTVASQWLADEVKRSALLKDFPVRIIPNGLNINLFKPYVKQEVRCDLQMKQNSRYILFGAVDPTTNKLKGFDTLIESLRQMQNKNVSLLVFGEKSTAITREVPIPVRYLGWISDEVQMAKIYSAADVMAVPSLQEVFGQTASEAMACGTPVVAFNKTGLADIVSHRETGFLAQPFDPADFARGLDWVLDDDEKLQSLSLNARKRAEHYFDIRKVIDKFIDLYQEVSGKSSRM
jgi:glycosyltransferase involved in cell wall biosynthesis